MFGELRSRGRWGCRSLALVCPPAASPGALPLGKGERFADSLPSLVRRPRRRSEPNLPRRSRNSRSARANRLWPKGRADGRCGRLSSPQRNLSQTRFHLQRRPPIQAHLQGRGREARLPPGTFNVERHIRGKWVWSHGETPIRVPMSASHLPAAAGILSMSFGRHRPDKEREPDAAIESDRRAWDRANLPGHIGRCCSAFSIGAYVPRRWSRQRA